MIRVLEIGDRTLSVQYHWFPRSRGSPTDMPDDGGPEIDGVWEGLEVAETTDEEDEQIVHELSKRID